MEEMQESTENTAAPKNNTVVIVLVAVIALLIAAVAWFVLADKDSTDTTTTTDTPSTETSVTPPAGMGGSTSTEFDPATATVVAAGLDPEQHVTTYFEAVVGGDFATAFDMLPAAKKAEYGDQAAFASQLTGYGITSFTIDGVVENGADTEVTATAVMPGGNFQYLWTFTKDGDTWLVKSRTLPGMN